MVAGAFPEPRQISVNVTYTKWVADRGAPSVEHSVALANWACQTARPVRTSIAERTCGCVAATSTPVIIRSSMGREIDDKARALLHNFSPEAMSNATMLRRPATISVDPSVSTPSSSSVRPKGSARSPRHASSRPAVGASRVVPGCATDEPVFSERSAGIVLVTDCEAASGSGAPTDCGGVDGEVQAARAAMAPNPNNQR